MASKACTMLVQTNGMTTQNQPAVAGKDIMPSMSALETKNWIQYFPRPGAILRLTGSSMTCVMVNFNGAKLKQKAKARRQKAKKRQKFVARTFAFCLLTFALDQFFTNFPKVVPVRVFVFVK